MPVTAPSNKTTPTPIVGPVLPLWSQCGGIGYTGSTNCGPNGECVFSSVWYSQCKPASVVTQPQPVTTKASATTAKQVSTKSPILTTKIIINTTKSPILTTLGTIQALWGQCGGIGWSGPTNCGPYADCVFSGPYYSQCQPSKTIDDTGLPLYSQCGGIGWVGSTVCIISAKCVYLNAYYSQCLPKLQIY